MVLDETVCVSLLDGICQKQMISPVEAYVDLFYHRDGRAEAICKWFRMSIAGNFIDDASSYTLNGIQFFEVSFGC